MVLLNEIGDLFCSFSLVILVSFNVVFDGILEFLKKSSSKLLSLKASNIAAAVIVDSIPPAKLVPAPPNASNGDCRDLVVPVAEKASSNASKDVIDFA